MLRCTRMEEEVISSLLMRNPKLCNADCTEKYSCTGLEDDNDDDNDGNNCEKQFIDAPSY